MKKAEELVGEKRSELTEATKKKRILERLKENKLEEYNQSVTKEEQALIDEFATQRYNNQDL